MEKNSKKSNNNQFKWLMSYSTFCNYRLSLSIGALSETLSVFNIHKCNL